VPAKRVCDGRRRRRPYPCLLVELQASSGSISPHPHQHLVPRMAGAGALEQLLELASLPRCPPATSPRCDATRCPLKVGWILDSLGVDLQIYFNASALLFFNTS